MAIAFDAFTHNTSGSGTSHSFSHTCSGSDRIILVYTRSDISQPTGITYNSVAMTKIADVSPISGDKGSCWYLVAPATGSNTVAITYGSSQSYSHALAVSYTGAKQTGQPDAFTADATQTGTTASITVTSTVDNCWIMAGHNENGAGATSAGANTTERGTGSNSLRWWEYSSNPKTPAGSQTLNFASTSSGSIWGIVGVSIAPQTGTAYSMSVTAGAFTLTGIAALFYKALNMTAAVGSVTLTGVPTAFRTGKGILAEVGSFILSGKNVVLRASNMLWDTQSKNSASWTPVNKNSASWSSSSKNSASWTPQDKN